MDKLCKACNKTVDAITEIMPEESIHYGKNICPLCNGFIDWAKKPNNEGIRTKTSKFTPEILGIITCELCGRSRDKLGTRETFDIHHKEPVEEGGADNRDNVLVLCSACHKMAHFLRRYLHHHLDNFYAFKKR